MPFMDDIYERNIQNQSEWRSKTEKQCPNKNEDEFVMPEQI